MDALDGELLDQYGRPVLDDVHPSGLWEAMLRDYERALTEAHGEPQCAPAIGVHVRCPHKWASVAGI